MVKKMTCVACPIGCLLEVVLDDENTVVSVAGNSCKRGITYAESEVTNPTRSLTSTVKLIGGIRPVVSVKSALPFPKNMMLDAMKIINETEIKAPVSIGDKAIKNILDTGIDIIVTSRDKGKQQ